MSEKMTPGRSIIEGLADLLESLRAGVKPEDRYRSTEIRRIVDTNTGEEIITRIVTDPKEPTQ